MRSFSISQLHSAQNNEFVHDINIANRFYIFERTAFSYNSEEKFCIYLYARGRRIVLCASEAAEKILTFTLYIPRCKIYIKLSILPFKIKNRIFLKVTNK